MTEEQVIDKAYWYAVRPRLSPAYFRAQLSDEMRDVFDRALLRIRQEWARKKK